MFIRLSGTSTLRVLRSYLGGANADYLDMRTRKLIHLILACLVMSAVVAPAAKAHNEDHDRGRGERSHEVGRGRGHGSDKERGHGRDKDKGRGHGHDDGNNGQASFFGAPGRSNCSRDPWVCTFVFSRSVTIELHDRLTWVLTEHMDYAEKIAARLCDRAEQEKECAGTFIAGLWNGVDELSVAEAENMCATVRLEWRRSDGLSQAWSRTNEACTD